MAATPRKSIASRLGFRSRRGKPDMTKTKRTTSTSGGARGYKEQAFGTSAAMKPTPALTTTYGVSPQQSETSTEEQSPVRELSSRDIIHNDNDGNTTAEVLPAVRAVAAAAAGAGTGIGGRSRVIFEGGSFRSIGDNPLGFTISPATEGSACGEGMLSRGARIHELPRREGAGERLALTPLLGLGDLITDIDGQDVRRLPFSEVLGLLTRPTPHVITTAVGGITRKGGSNSTSTSTSNNTSIKESRPRANHAGNAAKNLQDSLWAASAEPGTPGSSNKAAPPSTTRPLVLASSPLSPAALPPSSPTDHLGSPPPAPPLSEFRRGPWSRSTPSKWGSGGSARKDRNKSAAASAAAAPVASFSSPSATPTKSGLIPFKLASLSPWGGGTPGEKPGRMTRTRSMFSTTLQRMSPRMMGVGMTSPRAAAVGSSSSVPLFGSPPATPPPPSPAGTSPFDNEVDVAPRSPVSGAAFGVGRECGLSPTAPRCGQRELFALDGRGDTDRRSSSLRFSVDVQRDSSRRVLVGDEDGKRDRKGVDEGDDVGSRVVALVSREPMVSSSAAVFRSGRGSEEKDYLYETRYAGGDEEEKTEEDGKGQPRRPLQGMGANNVSGGGIERLASSAQSGERSPCREQQRVEEVPPREREEEEIVALSRYLAYAGREWPWVGKAVLWAEYVSLSGHHRWIRSEQCRNALLMVRGALYLLELPTEAVTRYSATGLPTRSRGSWYVRLNASDLSHVSVSIAPREQATGEAAQKTHAFDTNRIDNGSGLILHKRGRVGAYAWLECRNSASRDALVDLVSAWAAVEMKQVPLRVEFQSESRLSASFGGQRQGRKVPTLIDERQECPLW